MTSKLKVSALTLLALAILPATARADTNADVNAIYERIAEGIRTHDPEMSQKTYAADAMFLASMPGPIDAGEIVHQRIRANGERMKADGASMDIAYRLVRRTIFGDTAIDTGYYRVDMKRTRPEPASQVRYNKFLLTATRQPDGTWKITHDASLPASKEAFDAATPQRGLTFDM